MGYLFFLFVAAVVREMQLMRFPILKLKLNFLKINVYNIT